MKKLELTIEEGQALLVIAAHFNLPDKLAEEQNYTPMDRSLAAQEVGFLYREFRARSPLMQSRDRLPRFGPKECWAPITTKDGKPGHRCDDTSVLTEISLSDDIVSGIVWCLLVVLHPSSKAVAGVAEQVDVFWPIAAKLGKTKAIRETIGLVPEKIKRVRWKNDDEYDKEEAAVAEKGKE